MYNIAIAPQGKPVQVHDKCFVIILHSSVLHTLLLKIDIPFQLTTYMTKNNNENK